MVLLTSAITLVALAGACGGGGGTSATAPSAAPATETPVRTVAAGSVATSAASPAATVADAGATTAAAAMCARAAEALPVATVASGDLIELSGLAASRVNNGVLWAHNDSGDTPRVFAMDAQGGALAVYTLAGANALDWEDMASAPDASRGGTELYLGDIGDNARARTEIVVYRVLEPRLEGTTTGGATLSNIEKLTLRYPDGAHDAETLMVDPVSGDMIIVTKDAGGSQVFRVANTLNANQFATLEQVARIDFGSLKRRTPFPDDAPALARAGGALATGGDISPAGDAIAIRTYSAVWLWPRAAGQSIGEALAGAPCEAATAAEKQGEAIAFDADGRGYVTSSEGEHPPLHHFRVGN